MSKNYWKDQEGKKWLSDPALRFTLIVLGLFILYKLAF